MKTSRSQHKQIVLAKNAKIAESMKLFHEEKRKQKEQAKLIEEDLGKRFVSIANYRDVLKYTFTNITAATCRNVLESTKTGYFMLWSDLCDYIMQTDPQIKGMVNIRTHNITAKALVIEPSSDSPEAKAAADFAREQINNIPELDKLIRQMLMAIFKGLATAEIVYERDENSGIFKVNSIHPISMRRMKVRLIPVEQDGAHFQTNATTSYGEWIWSYWNYGDNDYGEGIDVQDMFPGKYLMFSPGDEIELQYRGLFRSIVESWFYKQAGKAFWASGIEKYAFPVTYAKVPKQTPENTRYQLANNLNNLANDASVVVDEDVEIDTISTGTTGGDNAYKAFVEFWDSQMAKLILGSTLTIEGGSGSANRSNGEIGERTVEDLVYADSVALAEMLKHQLVKYLISYNLHLFGGEMPPLPNVSFDVGPKDFEPIAQMHIDTGVITNNELRKSLGLPLWSQEQGGENVAKSVINDAMAAPSAFSIAGGSAFQDASTAYAGNKEKKKEFTATELAMFNSIKDKIDNLKPSITTQEIAEEMDDNK